MRSVYFSANAFLQMVFSILPIGAALGSTAHEIILFRALHSVRQPHPRFLYLTLLSTSGARRFTSRRCFQASRRSLAHGGKLRISIEKNPQKFSLQLVGQPAPTRRRGTYPVRNHRQVDE